MSKARFFLMCLSLLLVAGLALPAFAQDNVAITSTFGGGPDTFSQIYCTGTDCADMVGYMYMGLLGVDVETATIQPNQLGALAESWTVSDDNLVYDIKLREGFTWSDGTPITSADIAYHWEILNNPEAAHPQAWLLDTLSSLEVIDDYNIRITVSSPACSALSYIGGVSPLPSHILSQSAPAELATLEFNLAPTVTSGYFTFGQHRPAEITSLLANKEHPDAGEFNLDGIIQLVSSDQAVQIEQFLEGETNFLESLPPDRKQEFRENADLQVYEYPGNTWDYLGFNTADPTNPQPALAEDGTRIEQGIHPIFGDKRVRQALAHAVDVDAIIAGAVFGEADRMPAHIVPASWAFNSDLAPRGYDTELALSMLAEAGWVQNDEGKLVCQGCLYATEVDPAFEGSAMEFELLTNAGNTRREAIGAIIQDQLGQIGATVDFQAIEFNTLLEVMDSQEFDTFILGWRAGYPDDPNTLQLFGAGADIPGSGFNFTSFYNEEYFELEAQANEIQGCDPADRAPIYQRMQEIMQDEMPYLWLYAQNGMYVAQGNVAGFDPRPNAIDWNITSWTISNE